MQRVKNIEYNEHELYSEEETYAEEDQEYTAEDRDNFATLTPVVRAELDEAGLQASNREIADALWHYYWDVGKSVAYLKNSRTPRQQQQPAQKKEKAKSKFDQAAEKSAEKAGTTKGKQLPASFTNKTANLKLDAAQSTPPQTKLRSKGLDVPKLWAEQKSKRKASSAFVVIGHVDHGKSTLMGRLLLDTGAVAQRDIDKYKKQAAELNKASFALAWVMDTGSEERERGVTVDIAQHHFSTDKVDFTILDAPGHRDFVPNMIGGAAMADLAVLVVDANQLESGMKGQTREHILLAKATGLTKIVVAVNKLDASNPQWSRDAFKEAKAQISNMLTQAGFATEDVEFVPCSGLNGQNVVKAVERKNEADWVPNASKTLLQALEASIAPPISDAAVREPFRMQITDVFRGGITNPISIAGRMAQGNIEVGDTVLVQPSGEMATARGIEVAGESSDWAVAGQMVTLHLVDIDAQHLRSGDMICSTTKPVTVVKSFIASINAHESLLPQGVDVYMGRLAVAGNISAMISTTNEKGEVIKKKPRIVQAGQRANVKITLDVGVPIESGDRIVLRSEGDTVAAGKVDRAGG